MANDFFNWFTNSGLSKKSNPEGINQYTGGHGSDSSGNSARGEHLQQQRRDLTRISSSLSSIGERNTYADLDTARQDLTKISSRLANNDHPDARIAEGHVDAARQILHGAEAKGLPVKQAAQQAMEKVDKARQHIFNSGKEEVIRGEPADKPSNITPKKGLLSPDNLPNRQIAQARNRRY